VVLPDSLRESAESLIDPVPSPDGAGPPLSLVRGLARALQEQHFQMERKLGEPATTDGRLALRALTEGDAALVGIVYLAGEQPIGREALLAGIQDLRMRSDRAVAEFPGLPPVLLRQELFPHVHGSLFVLWAYVAKGWAGVNALYRHPPRSTGQILHPEKYYVNKKDPLRIEPWGLLRALGGRASASDTLGEYWIRRLLARFLPEEEAAKAGSGWAGDRLIIFPEGDGPGIAWITAWDGRAEARGFYQSYRRVLERIHRSETRPAGTAGGLLPEGPWLESKERFVFFLDGVSPERAAKMTAELWQGLEVGPDDADAEAPPFELAGGARALRLPESIFGAGLAHAPFFHELDEMRFHGAPGGR
jgi:hypothetical protein